MTMSKSIALAAAMTLTTTPAVAAITVTMGAGAATRVHAPATPFEPQGMLGEPAAMASGPSAEARNGTFASPRPVASSQAVASSPAGRAAPAFEAAISAVPEPASWAMMIFGMGAVGFALREAKRRSNARFDARIKRITAGLEA